MLTEFFSHAVDNPHGWGTAVYKAGKAEVLKGPESAAASVEAEKTAEKGFDTDLLLAHIRYATKGAVSLENTHPFVLKDISGTEWVFAHNGTVFESDLLSGYVHDQKGETDSERIFRYIIDSLNGEIREKAAGSTL